MFRIYFLMKRDMCTRLFLACQIPGFMCNYKPFNNRRYPRSKDILSSLMVTAKLELQQWSAKLPIGVIKDKRSNCCSITCVTRGTKYKFSGWIWKAKLYPYNQADLFIESYTNYKDKLGSSYDYIKIVHWDLLLFVSNGSNISLR